jgi:hypothetical protein
MQCEMWVYYESSANNFHNVLLGTLVDEAPKFLKNLLLPSSGYPEDGGHKFLRNTGVIIKVHDIKL